jgi:hypothetical protein
MSPQVLEAAIILAACKLGGAWCVAQILWAFIEHAASS